jgi:thymidylate synthase (FAD)
VFKFYVKCPIFVAREWQRHRTFSYNERSGRYKEFDPEFYMP